MHFIHSAIDDFASFVDLFGIAILVIGAVKFVLHYLQFEASGLRGSKCLRPVADMRSELGAYILLSLEFMIVSDIVSTALTHEVEDLYALALLVAIRTAISFFLGRELKEVEEAVA